MDLTGIRAHVSRDWAAVRALKEDGWIERLEAGDPAEGFRAVDRLYRDAKILRPDWPTEDDRRDDYLSHVRLSDLLSRAARVRR